MNDKKMKKCKPISKYVILCIDEQGAVAHDEYTGVIDYTVTQCSSDVLEVWKSREDGFLFVYCNRLEIGYWVSPDLVNLTSEDDGKWLPGQGNE